MILKLSTFVFKRVSKDLISLAILFITPLVLITILGTIADDTMNELMGIPEADVVALTMILAFQLFTGFYTLELMKYDLLKDRKWRMMALPIPMHRYMFSILIVTILYGGLQSYALTHYTSWMYDVTWGEQLRLIAGILVISAAVQTMYLNLALFIKSFKTMERAATSIALGSMLLGEVWFSLPDYGIFNFLGTYGNPFSLGVNILLDGMKGQWTTEGILSGVIFILFSLLMLWVSGLKGRRMYR